MCQQTILKNRDPAYPLPSEAADELHEIARILVDRLQQDGHDLHVRPTLDEMKQLLLEAVRSAKCAIAPAPSISGIASLIRD